MAVSRDAESCTEKLINMDVESCAGVMVTVLQQRPELAPVMVSVALPDLTYAPSSILTSKRAHGTIKSFNQQSGFGFITCPELHELFGRDVFVHGKQIQSFAQGSSVNFAVVLNKDNHPQAFDLADEQAKGGGKGDMGSASWGKGGGGVDFGTPFPGKGGGASWGMGESGYSKGKASGGKGKASEGKGPDVVEELGQTTGTIKSFSPNNGYGFIDCPEIREMGYQDVWMHHAELGDFKVGDQIIMTVFLNSKGKVQAKDLQPQGQAKRMRFA